MSWWSGSQLTALEVGVTIASAISPMLAMMLRCVSATPRGRSVLPDVYCSSARSPGCASCRPRVGTDGTGARPSIVPSAAITMSRRPLRRAQSVSVLSRSDEVTAIRIWASETMLASVAVYHSSRDGAP